jgi:15-cis-phytoene desaturase
MEILLPNGKSGVFGMAPIYKPFKTLISWLGNFDILSLKDKYDLLRFSAKGIFLYKTRMHELEHYTVLEFAKKMKLSDQLIHNLLVPLTAGVFFLEPARFSALIFFGLLSFLAAKWYKMGIGAFKGGMTEVMAAPILKAILNKEGTCELNCEVTEILIQNQSVCGVKVGDKTLCSKAVILATSLGKAQQLLSPHASNFPEFQPMLQLPSMPSVTFQIDLTTPCMQVDRVTFSPGTCLASYSEQSRTTFPSQSGRISIILVPPERFLKMNADEILPLVIHDCQKVGIPLTEAKVKNYQKIAWDQDFYLLTPGNENLKPVQATSIFGFAIAGDYTKQPYFTTMEGAVFSGKKAAEAVVKQIYHGC